MNEREDSAVHIKKQIKMGGKMKMLSLTTNNRKACRLLSVLITSFRNKNHKKSKMTRA